MSTSVNLDSEAWLEAVFVNRCLLNQHCCPYAPFTARLKCCPIVKFLVLSLILSIFALLLLYSLSLSHFSHPFPSSCPFIFPPFTLFPFLSLFFFVVNSSSSGPVLISLHFPASHFFSFIPLPAASYCPLLISRSKQCCYDLTAAISSIVPKYPASFWFFVLIISCCQLP